MAHKVVHTKVYCRSSSVTLNADVAMWWYIYNTLLLCHTQVQIGEEREKETSLLSLYHQLHSYVTEVTNLNSDQTLQSQLLSSITLPL